MRTLLIGSLCLILLVLVLSSCGLAATADCAATPLTLTEAKILLYTMPQSVKVRSEGIDVMWQRITSNADDQADYFVFQVFSMAHARIVPVIGSIAVNKHTRDVLDITADYRFVTSKQLRGVQRILRREHCVTPLIIDRFRYVNPEAGGVRLSPRDLQ